MWWKNKNVGFVVREMSIEMEDEGQIRKGKDSNGWYWYWRTEIIHIVDKRTVGF
jgi:hypothetical protein